MSVVAPERERTAPPARQEPPQPPPAAPPPRRPWGLLALGVVLLCILFAVRFVDGVIPSFSNPFAVETVDRSGPALLRSIQDLEEFRAAAGNFEVIVDVERESRLPDAIYGERTLFVAAGSVDAVVDFGSLGSGAVSVSDDRRRATIRLPRPTLSEPRLDLERSYVYDRRRGILNSFQRRDDNAERELYLLAEQKLAQAARNGSGLVARAETNTRAMLESLLRSLGFTDVTVRFAPR